MVCARQRSPHFRLRPYNGDRTTAGEPARPYLRQVTARDARSSYRPPAPACSDRYGVYQIGDVYARSVIVIRVPGSGFVP